MVVRVIGVLVTSVLIPIIVTFVTIHYLQPWANRPTVSVLGVLPVHFLEESQTGATFKVRHHRLAFIFKVHNSSPTPAIAHMALIDGCVKMDKEPLAAEINLPPKEQVSFDGKDIEVGYDRHKRTVQRLRSSGVFRDSATAVIPAYSTEYLGALVSSTGPYFEVTGSVSIRGDCSEIRVVNTRPSIRQLLELGLRYPRSLRNEFRTGDLKMSLIIGDSQIIVDPNTIRQQVYSLRWEHWPGLRLPQMFENPSEDFPPVSRFD